MVSMLGIQLNVFMEDIIWCLDYFNDTTKFPYKERLMEVELLHHTPLWVCSKAIRKCWASEDKSDTTTIITGPKDKALIERIGNKNKHASTLEHLYYNFDIDGISRACLQELARHRHASLSVKSSRYTLKELKDTPSEDLHKFLVMTPDAGINGHAIQALMNISRELKAGKSNDIIKYALPESYKTSLVWSINLRSLQNFLALRTNKAALWEIQDLAHNIYNELPEDHQYLFSDFVTPKQGD